MTLKTVPEKLPVSPMNVNNKMDVCKRRTLVGYLLISKSGTGDEVKVGAVTFVPSEQVLGM